MTTMLTKCDPVDGMFRDFWRTGLPQARTRDLTLRPRADIHESEQEYLIRMDMPGVQKEDLDVAIEKNILTVTATRVSQEDEKHKTIHTERYSASKYVRSFSLGDDADPDGIKGSLKDGVLTLSIAKIEKALPRKIEVD